MRDLLKNRVEMLFIYDAKDGNPNGDPMDENKPRLDEETGQNIVTDVRLKRTVRDYLASKGLEVFVTGEAITSEERAARILEASSGNRAAASSVEVVKGAILESCVDVRLFGGTIPTKLRAKGEKKTAGSEERGEGISLTGPVQFRMGRSFNRVKLQMIKGTAAFASSERAGQRSFREEWILPYSLLAFYGVANQNAAAETCMTVADFEALTEALWTGTKNLITRSKMEQNPRLLIQVWYVSGDNLHIGELDAYVKMVSSVPDEQIRDIGQVKLDVSELLRALGSRASRIEKVVIIQDPRCIAVDELGREVEWAAACGGQGLSDKVEKRAL